MPAYNFQARFADKVESGAKRMTIRKMRKRPTRPGDKLHLFTGQRTTKCRKLGVFLCTEVVPISIGRARVSLDGEWLGWQEMYDLARDDGFLDIYEFFAAFEEMYGRLFTGVVIRW